MSYGNSELTIVLTFSKVSTDAGVRLLNWKKLIWKDTIIEGTIIIIIITTWRQNGGSDPLHRYSYSIIINKNAFIPTYTNPADDEVIEDDSEERR